MERTAIVNGIRTPFIKAGTLFRNITSYELGTTAVRELLELTDLDTELVDEVITGTVANPPEAANVSRVISLKSGIPKHKTAYTVSRNCASGFEAVTSGCEKIAAGRAKIIIACGTESMSNIPFFWKKEFQELFTRIYKAKSIWAKAALFTKIRPSFFSPRIGIQLGLSDPVCGLNMGQTAEVLAKEFCIRRREQDEFSLISHKKASAARGKMREEIVPVYPPPRYNTAVTQDNGPRENQTLDALAGLRPFFEPRTGTVTAGNSSQVTDGAAAVLLMAEERAKEQGYSPLGYIRDYCYMGVDPRRMGIGPAYAIPLVLQKTGLSLSDIDLIEINEAFSVQVIACLKLLKEKGFEINVDTLNVNGGAVALGHPVGATGTRMIITLLKELRRRNMHRGIASLCVGGGQGAAVIVET